MAISSDILRGHTDTIILNILRKGDSYGYEITKRIKEVSAGNFDVKDATIYTAFRRMETEGLIDAYWGDGVGGARRRYYSISEKGLQRYKTKAAEWKQSQIILEKLIVGE